MKYLIFRYKCWKVRRKVQRSWKNRRHCLGLCCCVQMEFHPKARIWLNENFQSGSPYPDSAYWLGEQDSKEGYKNRIDYMKKFEKLALKTGAYKNGWKK